MRARMAAAALTVALSGALVPVARAHVAARSTDCDWGVRAIRAFAEERRISRAERTALAGLLAQLRAHPITAKATCVTADVKITTTTPTSGAGRTDVACLRAIGAVGALRAWPGTVVPQQTRLAAARAYAVLRAHEQHDGTVCSVAR